MKKRYLLVIFPLVYLYGLLTMHMKIFPFEQVQKIEKILIGNRPNKPRDHIDVSKLAQVTNWDSNSDKLVFVTYGQSNSVNSSQLGYETTKPVYMVYDGEIYDFQDPAVGGTGRNGSVWGRVGDQLIESSQSDSVFFTTTGWGGSSIEELTYRHQYDFFQSQLQMTLNRFGKIDGILFHQGESNRGSSESYKEDFLILVQKVRGVTDAPIYLSQVSLCKGSSDKILLDIQDEIIREEQGVLRGPNSDLLDDRRYRLPDYCHFSSAGLDELSKMWVESIIKSSEN